MNHDFLVSVHRAAMRAGASSSLPIRKAMAVGNTSNFSSDFADAAYIESIAKRSCRHLDNRLCASHDHDGHRDETSNKLDWLRTTAIRLPLIIRALLRQRDRQAHDLCPGDLFEESDIDERYDGRRNDVGHGPHVHRRAGTGRGSTRQVSAFQVSSMGCTLAFVPQPRDSRSEPINAGTMPSLATTLLPNA